MTGFCMHAAFLEHDTGAGHPERPARLDAILQRLQHSGVLAKLEVCAPAPAAEEIMTSVHPLSYIDYIARQAQAGPLLLDGDTVVSSRSFHAARLAVGAALTAVDKVSRGEWCNAFCAVRPPGHHAETAQAMGFCLFNNVAVAAEWLRRQGRAERVLIIDWDVHHGNGTQDIFYHRGDVFYFSVHEWPLYPGTGRAEEVGAGAGLNTTRNLPCAPHTPEPEYLERFEEAIAEVYEQFRPDFTLISAGFDAHQDDPLAHQELTDAGFARMTEVVLAHARRHCAARVVSILEGGYNLAALAASVEAHLQCMLAVADAS